MRSEDWYRIDNIAKIYPALAGTRSMTMYRIAATLTIPVEPEILQRALDSVMQRFPFFKVRLRKGLFWAYLESNPHRLLISEDTHNPLRPLIPGESRGFLLNVRYTQNRIAVDIFHVLTDGYGASIFLKTLTACYLSLIGHPIAPAPLYGILDIHETPTAEEREDAYKRYANFRRARRPLASQAFHLQGTRRPGHHLAIICGLMPLDRLSSVAKAHKVSITELIASVYLYQLYQIQQRGGHRVDAPVRISVPVNMRRFFPSPTLRNFFLFTFPGIEPAYGEYTFPEVLKLVHHFMQSSINEKHLNALMAANVSTEKNWLVRACPLVLKNVLLRLVHRITGESTFSGILSNLGNNPLPGDMAPWVSRLELLIGPSRCNPVNAGVIGSGSQMVINLTSTIEEADFQREFFRHFVRLGIPVRIESNRLKE